MVEGDIIASGAAGGDFVFRIIPMGSTALPAATEACRVAAESASVRAIRLSLQLDAAKEAAAVAAAASQAAQTNFVKAKDDAVSGKVLARELAKQTTDAQQVYKQAKIDADNKCTVFTQAQAIGCEAQDRARLDSKGIAAFEESATKASSAAAKAAAAVLSLTAELHVADAESTAALAKLHDMGAKKRSRSGIFFPFAFSFFYYCCAHSTPCQMGAAEECEEKK